MSERHTFPLIAGRLRAPFPHITLVQTVASGVVKHRIERITLPMISDEIDVSGVRSNTGLAFLLSSGRQIHCRVIRLTKTSITLQSHANEKALLLAISRYVAGEDSNCEIPVWSRYDFPLSLEHELSSLKRVNQGLGEWR